MSTNREAGRSVYIDKRGIAYKESHPLYSAVRELVEKTSQTKEVLDVGCNDLPATRKLIGEGFKVYGLDLDISALKPVHEHTPDASVAVANALHLPIDPQNNIDTILMLDVLEHMEWEQAKNVLREIAQFKQHPTIIASMPIISPHSLFTWKEGLKMARKGRRPAKGLFDRTHKILTDVAGHHKLFSEAGYRIEEEFYTNWIEGVTGEWKTVQPRPSALSAEAGFYKALGYGIPRIIYPNDVEKQIEMKDKFMGYQGLYILRPNPTALFSSPGLD